MEPQVYTYPDPWIVALVVGLVLLLPTWRVFRRAGMHPAWSLLVLLGFPVGVLVVLALLALRGWPADREVAR